MVRIIAFVNQKGGVAKTTSTINVGAGLALAGKKVLLIDVDPQGNLTASLGVQSHSLSFTIHEVLKGSTEARNAIVNVATNYDIIPSDIRLSGAEMELNSLPGREMILKEALGPIADQYDYILLDCPPALNILTLNALSAAKEVFVPLQTEFLALHGVAQLIQVVDAVKKRLNPSLEITGVITTLYDRRKRLNREVAEKIKAHFGSKVFKTAIRNNVALSESQAFSEDIFRYKASSNGAKDYKALCKEILKQEDEKS